MADSPNSANVRQLCTQLKPILGSKMDQIYAAYLAEDGEGIHFISLNDNTKKHFLETQNKNDHIRNVLFSPDGNKFLVQYLSGYIILYKTSDFTIIKTIEGDFDETIFTQEGDIIAASYKITGSNVEGRIFLIDGNTGDVKTTILNHGGRDLSYVNKKLCLMDKDRN